MVHSYIKEKLYREVKKLYIRYTFMYTPMYIAVSFIITYLFSNASIIDALFKSTIIGGCIGLYGLIDDIHVITSELSEEAIYEQEKEYDRINALCKLITDSLNKGGN